MDRELILENERTYSRDELRIVSLDFLKYKALLTYIIMEIIFLILGGFFIGISFVFDNDITILTSGIIIIAFIFFLMGFYLFVRMKIKKSEYKETTYKYSFYSDELVVSIDSINSHQNSVLKYSDVVKVVKRKEYTFVFFNKVQAFFFLNSDLNDEVFNVLKSNVIKYKE